jgi:hypothetical protein
MGEASLNGELAKYFTAHIKPPLQKNWLIKIFFISFEYIEIYNLFVKKIYNINIF